MSGGERSKAPANSVKLFAENAIKLGWEQAGPLDENVRCQVCDSGSRAHGVDGIFTLNCPFTGRHRAVFFESKRYKLSSVGGSSEISKWLKDAATKASHLAGSSDFLLEDRGVPRSVLVDTVVVAWDCYDEWNEERARRWVADASPGIRPKKPLLLLTLLSPHLDRLHTLAEFAETRFVELEFSYADMGHRQPPWSQTLAPEALSSDLLAIRYRPDGNAPLAHGVLMFNTADPRTASFALSFAHRRGLFHYPEIAFFVFCGKTRANELQAELDSELQTMQRHFRNGRFPTVSIETLTTQAFRS